MKDFITLLDYEPGAIEAMIACATDLKKRRLIDEPQVLKGKTGVLIFEKPSLRTLLTFETAIHELGGHTVNLPPSSVGMGKRETIKDVARNLERLVHLIVARTFSHNTVLELSANASIPVINALTDLSHPCQALAFGLTAREHFGSRKIKVAFIGDGNNVCNSLMELCAILGWSFVAACPPGYEPRPEVVAICGEIAAQTGGNITISSDPSESVRNAQVIYTDVWASMGQEHEADERKYVFSPFQVDAALVAKASPEVRISHCLPAHRDEEISSEVLDSDRCIAFDEAENRLHIQKAVIVTLFSPAIEGGHP